MWRGPPRDEALAAIEAVYRERFAGFVRFAQAITGEEQAALDAVHDGFVRAVRYRRGLRDRELAAGWICRIVANEARKRRGEAARRITQPADPLDTVTSSNGHHEAALVRAALAALPERQRLALFLRYYADLDYAGIATALNITRGTVSATLHAAHANLQTQLKEIER
jgi:RNA polymerase sigma factor (sigma-70 family)